MVALVCDACGGILTMSDSGEFAVCNYCGVCYTKNSIIAKVQEMKGTVEAVNGDFEKDRLLKKAHSFLSLGDRNQAASVYAEVTQEYPEEYRGWLGRATILSEELYENLTALPLNHKPIDLNDLEHPVLEMNGCSGAYAAVDILHKLAKMNAFYNALLILDSRAATSVNLYEEKFLQQYAVRNLPFLNWLSAEVLVHYEIIVQCSPAVQSWAIGIVNEYIHQFLQNEQTELFWRNVSDKLVSYPKVKELLSLAEKCAQTINNLDLVQKRILYKAMGFSDYYNLPEVDCCLWIGKHMIFSTQGYKSEYNRTLSDIRVFSEKEAHAIIEECTNRLSSEIQEASALIKELRLHKDALTEIFMHCTAWLFKFREDTLFYKNYSYHIDSVDLTGLDYTISYKSKDLFDFKRKSEKKRVSIDSLDSHLHMLRILRKYTGHCEYCGSKINGNFSKVCSQCGKAINSNLTL